MRTDDERGRDADPAEPEREPPAGVEAAGLADAAERSRASGVWASVLVALVVLLALALFIGENGQSVRVAYLGAHGTLPLGVALLLAAVVGGLVVVLAGTARILQLRRRARRARREAGRVASGPPSQ